MKCQILFSGKNKKNITSLSSAETAHSKRQIYDIFSLFILENRL